MLVHGNRAIVASVFQQLGSDILEQPIPDFPQDYEAKVYEICEKLYPIMLDHLTADFPNRALAVLFKGTTNCRTIYDTVAMRISNP